MKEYHESVAQQTPQPDNASVYKSINYISVLVGIIVMGAFFYDNHSVTVSVLAGVGFYLLVAMLLILSPYATQVAIAYMREVTIRRYNALPYEAQDAQQNIQVVDHPRLPSMGSTPPVRLPEAPSYVPAVPRINDTVKLDACNFINQLFDGDGRPLPSKITRNKGQIQHKSPTPEAVEYMASLGIVRTGDGNTLYFNVTTFPTHRDALNCIRTGVRQPLQVGGG